jgi:hypothetical protein
MAITLAQLAAKSCNRTLASNLLISLNNSLNVAPNFWLNPRNSVSYPLVVQTPAYRINSAEDLWALPIASGQNRNREMLMNVAKFGGGTVPTVTLQIPLSINWLRVLKARDFGCKLPGSQVPVIGGKMRTDKLSNPRKPKLRKNRIAKADFWPF